MSRSTARILVAPVVLALAGGCQLLIGLDGGSPRKTGSGGGGAGGATSTSSSTASGTGGTGTGGTGTGGTGGTGGTDGGTDSGTDSGATDSGADGGADSGVDGGCTTAATCPAAAECHVATCTGGVCATTMPAAGSCAGGKVCGTPTGPNGGTCVGCNVDADCPAPQACGATNLCALPPRVLLLAGGGGQSTVGAAYDVAGGWGAATTLTATTASDLAVAMMPSGQGVGLIQGPSPGNQLEYTFFNGPGTSPPWAAFTPLNSDVTRGKPALAVTGATAHVVFQDAAFLYQHEAYTAGTWSGAPTPVVPAGLTSQPCGPWPGVLAALSSGVSLVFTNGNCPGTNLNDLFNTDLTSAGWQAFKNMANNPVVAPNTYPGAAVAAPLSGSPELVIAYSVVGAAQIQTSYRVNGAWMGYMPINGVLSNDELALAPLATGGGVVLAYRGTDGKLYTTLYTVGSASWSTPAPPFTSPTTIAGPPAVTQGIGVAAAEMAYLDATGAAWHTRLIGGMWTAPLPVAMGAAGFTNLAIASGP